jgi:hypothetical protein
MTCPWPTYTMIYIYQCKIELIRDLSPIHHAIQSTTTQTMHGKNQWWQGTFIQISHFHRLLGLEEDRKYSLAHSCWYNPPLVAVVLDLD